MPERVKNKKRTGKSLLLTSIPSVSYLLQNAQIRDLCQSYPIDYVTDCIRQSVEELRGAILNESATKKDLNQAESKIVSSVRKLVSEGLRNKIMKSINGAGVILHTGLGRAPLSESAQNALHEATVRYSLLATDRGTGKRGDRNSHNDELLRRLTGAEASLVVNNNSAAVMLALNTFGMGKESIISRGELVEIGGAFRIPDVMRRSGTIMVEVGTTNKTHLRDYVDAITDESAVLLKVHPSNYRINGFHQEVPICEVAKVAEEHRLIQIYDIGSGALIDLRRWGLPYEPTVPEAIEDGADIVTFSGDKLLGGPQCGILVGKKRYIDVMKSNPLMRAFRCDKLILSALNGTLRLFIDPDRLPETHPIYTMMTSPVKVVNRRARRITNRLKTVGGNHFHLSVRDGETEMGSGSLPTKTIPTRVVVVVSDEISAENLGLKLRLASPPLFTRIEGNQVLIDARTVGDDEIPLIEDVFRQVFEVTDADGEV